MTPAATSEAPMRAIVFAASSDIGAAMCERWLAAGWEVYGTYKTSSALSDRLSERGARLYPCDANDPVSVEACCAQLSRDCPAWDVMVNGIGLQDPVGPFAETDFVAWQRSIDVNFTQQLRMLHALLPTRNRQHPLGPMMLFFAGGGTNNATVNYSAYTISKIALIKMCELLDAEIPDLRTSIVGPGWVKTKIHAATLAAGPTKAGDNFQRTQQKLASDECTPMKSVLDCCDWIISRPRNEVGGRNFSVVFDAWGNNQLEDRLAADADMYKLRRNGNEWRPTVGD